MPASLPSTTIYSVTRLNQTVRQLLEREIGTLWLVGEISNFSRPASGHWYFTLKDASAQVRCAMFRHQNRYVAFTPASGQQVLIRAAISLYEPRGDYQLIAETMQPAGDGLLQQQFDALRQKLAAEGLFDQFRKQPLPSPVRRVGVITSTSGAALHDILNVLRRRDPSLPVVIYPSVVQGAEAPASLIRKLMLAGQRRECDVLIVGRGGGSLEDLWCFNDEGVARAIAACPIPVISAVGHETDVTIADYVADLRAPTPSAAAELVSRDRQELQRQLLSQQRRLEMALDHSMMRFQQQLARLAHRLEQQHPRLQLARQQTRLVQLTHRLKQTLQRQREQTQFRQAQALRRLIRQQPAARIARAQQQAGRLDLLLRQAMQNLLRLRQQRLLTLLSRLEDSLPLRLAQWRQRQQTLRQQLLQYQPLPQLFEQRQALSALDYRLQAAARAQLTVAEQRFATALAQLETVSPLATLARGYSVTVNDQQRVIRQIADVAPGATLHTRLADGWITSQVSQVKAERLSAAIEKDSTS